jgi:hypothetical protein
VFGPPLRPVETGEISGEGFDYNFDRMALARCCSPERDGGAPVRERGESTFAPAMAGCVVWLNGANWIVDGEPRWGADHDVPGGRLTRHVGAEVGGPAR